MSTSRKVAAAVGVVGFLWAGMVSAIAAGQRGQNPIGMAISNTGKKLAFVLNDVTRNVTVLDLNTQAVAVDGSGQPLVAIHVWREAIPARRPISSEPRVFTTNVAHGKPFGCALITSDIP